MATNSSSSASLTSPSPSSSNSERGRKPLWRYVKISNTEGVNTGEMNWECNFCHMQKKTTYTRVVKHLLKQGGGIKACPKVTQQDMDEMRKLIEEEEKRQIVNTPKNIPLPPTATRFMSDVYKGYDDSSSSKKRKGSDNDSSSSLGKAFNIQGRNTLNALIARFFYASGLPFHLARSPYYAASYAYAANHNLPGFVPPGYNLLRTSLLQQEKANVERLLQPIKSTWREKGVSIVSDGWSDSQRRPLINFMAVTESGPMFLKAVDCSGEIKDKTFIFNLMREVIEEVGPQNVVQVITDNARNCAAAGALLCHHNVIVSSGFPISASFSTVRVALNSTSTRHCWMMDALRENLSTELNGWWGRLVFRPKRCLMTYALKPSTSCVSNPLESTFVVEDILVNLSGSITPQRNSKGVESNRKLSLNLEQHHSPIDSTYVVQEKILVNYSDATTSTRSLLRARNHSEPLVTQAKRNSAAITLSPVSLKEPSCKPTTQGGMSNSISNVFHQAAERLQDELLDRLETMDVKDHAAMSREAEATFAALDCLLFDYQDFKWRVEELIRCASQLVEIDRAMPTSDSFQKLVEICSRERGRLDEINHKHAEAVEALINSKKHVKVLQEEISSTLDWLFQIEADVSCCEVEMRCLELQLEETSKNKELLEGKYLIASKELEESQKLLLEQREVE